MHKTPHDPGRRTLLLHSVQREPPHLQEVRYSPPPKQGGGEVSKLEARGVACPSPVTASPNGIQCCCPEATGPDFRCGPSSATLARRGKQSEARGQKETSNAGQHRRKILLFCMPCNSCGNTIRN